jgi:hypothetical protein
MKKEIVRCPHCQAKMVEYKHSLSKQIVEVLYLFVKLGGVLDVVDLNSKMPYSKRCNFPKLQYWGLITKVKTEKKSKGLWAITPRGKDFITGQIPIQKSVWTYRNNFMRFDGEFFSMEGLGYEPYRQKEDYVSDQKPRFLNHDGQFEFFYDEEL